MPVVVFDGGTSTWLRSLFARHRAIPWSRGPGAENRAGEGPPTVSLFTVKQNSSFCSVKIGNPEVFFNSRISYPEHKFIFFVLG